MRCKRGPTRALRIILVCLRDSEDGQDGVTDEFLRRPAEPLDLRVQHREEIALQVADILRIELVAKSGRARKIGEEHRDNASLVLLA